jgi:sugar lactone lactonase YvrE
VYIGDYGNYRVRELTPSGVISTVAGTGHATSSGDGGPATAASIGTPDGVAVDPAGNLYIASGTFNVVRRVSPKGTISTVAGDGDTGGQDDVNNGEPATSVALNEPDSIAVDSSGTLYIAEFFRETVREVPRSGIIGAFADSTVLALCGKDDVKVEPAVVATDSHDNVYIADREARRIVRIAPDKASITDIGPLTEVKSIDGLAVDRSGRHLYVADEHGNRVWRATLTR